jgi:hypothetical protein
VHARILIALSAWLLGAVTATGGCLMAVSLLGNSFGASGGSSQQLTIAAVHQALAAARQARSPAPSAVPPRMAQGLRARSHSPAARPTPTATPAQSGAVAGTVLTSPGGSVTAICESAGTYLLSWSPAQGYGVGQVARGPAAVASVVFDGGTRAVTMQVSCASGTPVSSTSWSQDE